MTREKELFAIDIPPSFDSEGLFPLDDMEENIILEDDDHSEDDLSDTDGNDVSVKLFFLLFLF